MSRSESVVQDFKKKDIDFAADVKMITYLLKGIGMVALDRLAFMVSICASPVPHRCLTGASLVPHAPSRAAINPSLYPDVLDR